MIHEIKFRAWDKENKKMLEVQEISFWQEKIRIFDTKQNHYLTLPFCLLCMHFEDVEIMQYTGLKDKNNIEVYEGDIVQNVNNNNIWKVVYNHSNACYELTRKKDGINSWEHGAIIGLPRSYKVIGNIYENKELLQ